MENTRHSLIERLGGGEQSAWDEVNEIYRPMIRKWLSSFRLQPSDVEDMTQEVLTVLVRQIGDFRHNGQVGAFRNWLRTTTINVTRNSLRRRNITQGKGGSVFQASLAEMEDPNSADSRAFDEEHNRYVVAYLLREIERDFAEATLQIFRVHVVDDNSVAETAAILNVTNASVHTAKSRVLRKLRQRAGEILDDF